MTSRSRCCAENCANCKFRHSKFTFHPFPKNVEMKKRWAIALNKPGWVPPPHSIVCSAHFTDNCFQEILGFNVLKSLAVPSILNPPGNKGLTGKALPVRPKGILKSKGSSRKGNVAPLKVKSDIDLFPKKPSNKNEAAVVEVKLEDDDDVEMIDVSPSSIDDESSKNLTTKVVSRQGSSLTEYLLMRNACVQTENLYTAETVCTQTTTSIPNPDDDLGDSSKLIWQVESYKTKVERLQSQINMLQNRLKLKEKEVLTLVSERHELSSRLNEKTMGVVEHAFKEVLQVFLNDDHSSMEKFLTKTSKLCLNTNISFVRSIENADEKQD